MRPSRPVIGLTTIGVTIIACLAGSAARAAPAEGAGATQVTGSAADGTRYYEDSIVIAAPTATLWAAFTDTASYRRWAAPVASIDFRLGGAIEAGYDPKGRLGDPQNVRNAIIGYIPGRLLVFRNVQAPDRLPGKDDYAKTVKTVEFQALGPSETRVTVSGMGFGDGRGFDQLYAFFSQGDREMLVTLKAAMESKPAG